MTTNTPSYEQSPQGLYTDADHKGMQPGFVTVKAALDSVLRVRVPYLFEIEADGKTLRSYVLHLAPNTLSFTTASGVEFAYTFGAPIREHNPPHEVAVDMRGRAGQKFYVGCDREGNVVFKDGATLNNELLAFLDYYQRLAAQRQAQARTDPDAPYNPNAVRLILRCLDERRHHYVEPFGVDAFTQSKDTQSARFSPTWRLRLRAWAPAAPARPTNVLGPLADASEWLAQQIDNVNALAALGVQALRNTRADLDVLREPFFALQRTGGLMREAVDAVGDLAAFPAVLVGDALAVAAQFVAALADLDELGDTLSRTYFGATASPTDPDPGLQMQAAGDDALRWGYIAAGSRGLGPRQIGAAFARNLEPQSPTAPGQQRAALQEAVQPVRVFLAQLAPGEDLAAFAARVLGERDAWGRIVEANQMPDPFHLSDGSPLRAGITLQVPGLRHVAPFADPDGDGRGEFGQDLKLANGDLVWEGDDLALAWGPANLKQALGLRFATPQGSCQSFPAYGLVPVIGEAQIDAGLLAAHVREQALRDPRVVDVVGLSAVNGSGKTVVEATLLTARLNIPFRAPLTAAAPT